MKKKELDKRIFFFFLGQEANHEWEVIAIEVVVSNDEET